ncbi:hypothetical protein GCM10027065_07030 [Rhodanobacter koreensis]
MVLSPGMKRLLAWVTWRAALTALPSVTLATLSAVPADGGTAGVLAEVAGAVTWAVVRAVTGASAVVSVLAALAGEGLPAAAAVRVVAG